MSKASQRKRISEKKQKIKAAEQRGSRAFIKENGFRSNFQKIGAISRKGTNWHYES
jgi:hypothetical protein